MEGCLWQEIETQRATSAHTWTRQNSSLMMTNVVKSLAKFMNQPISPVATCLNTKDAFTTIQETTLEQGITPITLSLWNHSEAVLTQSLRHRFGAKIQPKCRPMCNPYRTNQWEAKTVMGNYKLLQTQTSILLTYSSFHISAISVQHYTSHNTLHDILHK